MSISMEIPVFASFRAQIRTSSSSSLFYSSKHVVYGYLFRRQSKFRSRVSNPVQMSLSSEKHVSSIGSGSSSSGDCVDFWGDSEYVEVIGIGSRKDAVLDFCLDSPFESSSLRFWNILNKDSMKVQLQQRFLDKATTPRIVNASLSITRCSKTIILVATAGCGLDHIVAFDLINTIRSANGYAIAIVLKPFSFEGKKRQDEVRDLAEKLEKRANFVVDIDTEKLLQKELVTLNEALKTAHNAVLTAINAIFVLTSEIQKKHIGLPHNNLKEIKYPELIKILECYKEAKVGFGAAHDIKTSIAQAIFDCPFLSNGIKDLNGAVVCIVATSNDIEKKDLLSFIHTFRQTTEYMKEIILSTIHEPRMEPNMLLTTVIIFGCNGQPASRKSSILSKLAQRFPFVFNILRGHHQETDATVENPNGLDNNSPEPNMDCNGTYDEINASRDHNDGYEDSDFQSLETHISSNSYDLNNEGIVAFQREQLAGWNLGSGHQIAQEWAKEREADFGPCQMHENQSNFCLPVGIRTSKELKDGPNILYNTQHIKPEIKDDMKTQLPTQLKGKYADPSKKQGVLSARAASMLETERDKPKTWNPTVEIQFRGGVYRGRCQGGLPEGKGCLTLEDGRIYDGMWRCGKRSGPGYFYFSNGDVFQGSWRDDLMHGKGWFYFHTGDRWFANFWKGKANGEGRFYSKNGDIFFGNFRDGWRHGRFLWIDVDGTRYSEIWDEGIFVSREQLELDSDLVVG